MKLINNYKALWKEFEEFNSYYKILFLLIVFGLWVILAELIYVLITGMIK